ncbi:hypothetical protein ID866_12123, partial [Astraeus odoratus]
MSMHKSSMTTGALAVKIMDWTKVPDEELVTDIDDMDLAEEAEKHQKEEEERQQKEAEAEQKWKDEERKQAAAAEARKWQQADSEAQAKERCEWPEVEMMASRAGMLPQGGEHKKQAKKAANDNDNNKWGELIQAVSTHMDMANSHLERIASAAQSNGRKMQRHYMLMEGLVGQQQVLLSKLVEITSAAGSGGSKEVVEDQEELKELQGEESGGQEGDTEGVPGGAPEGEPEDALGNELEDGAGAEDGAGEEAQRDK